MRQGLRCRALGNGVTCGTTGAPMTYMHKGKQYIVAAIGVTDHPAEFVALALR
jgi:hypothetical protein